MELILDSAGDVRSRVLHTSIGHDVECLERLIHFQIAPGVVPTTLRVVVSARATGYGDLRYEDKITIRLYEDAEDAGLKPPLLRVNKLAR